ncbi:hypothetical protein AA313_de0205154 [Arthrobotrys entomopaga]|nr:hypothetical protein AA313_de0205154 [Arthrobotrys entomopaga]
MSDKIDMKPYSTTRGLLEVEKHIVPAFPIREHPRALWSDGDRLDIVVNHYKPVNNPNPEDGDVTLLCAHGNGFHKELYEPFFECLVEEYEKKGTKIRGIWIADFHNQGDSGVVNEGKLGGDVSWFDHSRDLLSLVSYFPKDIVRPIAAIGHSMGACQLFRLSVMHPTLFTCLVGLDPTISAVSLFPEDSNPITASAKRRDIWPSREAAVKFFKSRPWYQNWDPEVLDLHMQYGLRKLPTPLYPDVTKVEGGENAVTLATTKHQECFTFWRTTIQDRTDTKDMFRLLKEVKTPVCYIQGGDSPINYGNGNEVKMEHTPKPCEMHVLPGVGHLVPQEKPRETAEIAADYIYRRVKIWGKQMREYKEDWPATTTMSPRFFEPRRRESKL